MDFNLMRTLSFFYEKYSNKFGFTLLELMIVISIVGILSTVATAEYEKYAARARQTEAKIKLANFYTGQESFWAEQNSYTLCVSAVGIDVNPADLRYYWLGFNVLMDVLPRCGPDGSQLCNYSSYSSDPSLAIACNATNTVSMVDWAVAPNLQTHNMSVNNPLGGFMEFLNNSNAFVCGFPIVAQCLSASQSTYIIGAGGLISDSPIWDWWTIDQDKRLINKVSGL